MIRLAFLVLVTGLTALEARAQQTTKSTSKTTPKQTSKAASSGWGSDDGWGTPVPATKPAKKASAAPKPATHAAIPTAPAAPTDSVRSNNSGAASGGFGSYGGGEAIDRTPGSSEGISVAPGMPLLPAGRTRSDYMGRPIQSKPSMRPRSTDKNGTDLLNNNPGQRP